MDLGLTLAGTGGVRLDRAVPSSRQSILPLFLSSLWSGNETPRVSTCCPHLPSLFIFLFISVLLCHSLSFSYFLCTALPFPQPPQPSGLPCRIPATRPPPPHAAPPQTPFYCLGPFVLTVVCQLGLHFESKSKAVCCEKMEKWQDDRG